MKTFLAPAILFLTYLIIGIATITHYGINWDEPSHFIRGQTFLRFLTTGKKDYSDLPQSSYLLDKPYKLDFGFENPRRSIYQYSERGLMFYTYDIEKRGTHPAFSDIMAALFNYIFYVKLGIAPDIYSYNYYVIFVAALLTSGIYLWVKKLFGRLAALVSSLSLILFPVFWAEAHYNVKDIPQAVFYSFALIFFYQAIISQKIKFVWFFALAGGFAFATKFNFVFVIPTIALWLILRWVLFYREKITGLVKKNKVFFRSFLLVPVVIMFIWIFTFPAAWYQPKLLLASLSYYSKIGTSPVGNDWRYPFYYLFFASPIVTLLYSFVGSACLFLPITKRQKDAALLIIIWFLIPIVRVMIPGTAIYGGVRQIIEYIPAMAILAGIGASIIAGWFQRRRTTLYVLIVVSFIPIFLKMIAIHPNEGVFFNPLIGGLAGAKERGIPDWGQTLGNPYRQGIDWINKNAQENARISLGYELWSNLPYIWVRNDIYYNSQVKSGPARLGEYVMTVTNISEFQDWYRMRDLEVFVEPVYQVMVDGVAILKVWKNDKDHLKPAYKNMEEEKIANIPLRRKNLSYTIDLGKPQRLLRIEYEGDPTLCSNLDGVMGSLYLYKDDISERPETAYRASAYDFNDKLSFREPFFLFADDTAKVIVFNASVDYPCFQTLRRADVYVIKEQ